MGKKNRSGNESTAPRTPRPRVQHTVTIEPGVPIPPGQRASSWPLATMKPGDSFVVPNTANLKSFRGNVAAFQKRHSSEENPLRFSVRKDQSGNMRCWRVE